MNEANTKEERKMEQTLELPAAEQPKKRRFGRRTVMVACAVVLIAAALVLNFILFGDKWQKPLEEATPTAADEAGETGKTADAAAGDGYFSATQVSRQRARDEALEVLQSVVDNDNADEAAKTEALADIAALARAMETEANIESLVRSRGFSQCVAVVNGDTCSVVVQSAELTPAGIAQINDVVYEQAGIAPAGVKIIAK